MLRCVCGRGTFETHLGDNRRNPAALANPFFRLGACQGGFDNFDGCGRYIVFRPQSDDGTAAVKNISNELESGGAHQTVGINARSEEHTSELQSPCNLVCRLLLEKKKNKNKHQVSDNTEDRTHHSAHDHMS